MTVSDAGSAVVERLEAVRRAIADAAETAGRQDPVHLVAVTKMFDAAAIRPALDAGQRIVGENRVQEAKGKWPALRAEFPDVELHLLGPLQTNKAKDAVALFDVIQSVDREKVAAAIARAADGVGRMPRCLVQVNIGREPQKAGATPDDVHALAERCRALGLPVIGLMAIPPADDAPAPHFEALASLAPTWGSTPPWACPAITARPSHTVPGGSGWGRRYSGRVRLSPHDLCRLNRDRRARRDLRLPDYRPAIGRSGRYPPKAYQNPTRPPTSLTAFRPATVATPPTSTLNDGLALKTTLPATL